MPIRSLQISSLLRHFQLAPGKPAIAYGLRGAIGLCIPIVLGKLTGHLAWGMIAALAALVIIQTDVGGAYRQKAVAMLATTIGLALAMVLTTLVINTPWLAVLLTFFWVFAAGLTGLYGNTATMIGFATSVIFIVSLELPDPPTALQRFVLALVGGAWAMVLSLGLWGLYPYRPIFRVVANCYLSLAAFIELAGEMTLHPMQQQDWLAEVTLAQDVVIQQLEVARKMWAAVRTGRQGASSRGIQLLILIQDASQIINSVVALAEMLEVVADHPRFSAVQAEVQQAIQQIAIAVKRLAVAIAKGGEQPHLEELAAAIAALETRQQGLRTQLLEQPENYSGLVTVRKIGTNLKSLSDQVHADAEIAEQLRHGRWLSITQPNISGLATWNRAAIMKTLRDNLTFRSVGLRHALRLGLTTAIAVLIALLSHLPRGNWIALTVLVTLKPSFGGTSKVAVQRVGGTVLGGIIAIALSSMIRNHIMLLASLFLLAFVAIALKPLNYGVFVILLTPLVVLISNFADTGNWEIGVFRILDTLIGGGLALLGGYLLFPSWERERLPTQLATTLRINLAYFQRVVTAYLDPAQNSSPIQEMHRQADLQNANAAAAAQRLLSDPRHVQGAVEPVMTIVVYTRSFSNAVTTLTEHLREFSGQSQLPELEEFAAVITQALNNFADVLQQKASLRPLPVLEPYLEQIHSCIQRLYATHVAERTATRSGATSTLQAVQEHTLTSTELDRIANSVTVMHGAIARLQQDSATPFSEKIPVK